MAGYGPPSPVWSFNVDLDGTCGLGGIPATAKSNNFCRVGTFPEHHEAIWTFIAGDHTLAIARNPFTTYLKLLILDPKTKQPLEEMITCWSATSAFNLGFQPPAPPEGKYDFGDLPVEEPPPTPTPVPLTCQLNLPADQCKAAGGKYDKEKTACYCP